jgi:hypothetical protein
MLAGYWYVQYVTAFIKQTRVSLLLLPPLPPGRDLPPGALNALSATEKLCSLQQYQKMAKKLTPEQVRAGLGCCGRLALAWLTSDCVTPSYQHMCNLFLSNTACREPARVGLLHAHQQRAVAVAPSLRPGAL